MDESPMESVLTKPHSSIHVGLEMVKRGDASAFVSAGNSGAVDGGCDDDSWHFARSRPPRYCLAGAGERRPRLAYRRRRQIPRSSRSILAQFAVMGSVYCHRVRGVPNPRVGILANGEEASKGTDLTRAAAAMLGGMRESVDYIGYVEGRRHQPRQGRRRGDRWLHRQRGA